MCVYIVHLYINILFANFLYFFPLLLVYVVVSCTRILGCFIYLLLFFSHIHTHTSMCAWIFSYAFTLSTESGFIISKYYILFTCIFFSFSFFFFHIAAVVVPHFSAVTWFWWCEQIIKLLRQAANESHKKIAKWLAFLCMCGMWRKDKCMYNIWIFFPFLLCIAAHIKINVFFRDMHTNVSYGFYHILIIAKKTPQRF